MATKPKVNPLWIEVSFEEEGLDARALVTRTNIKGITTFASKAYRDMTKFSRSDLIGSPHNIVRHPFMPESLFKEMWDAISQGKHWNGLVMNLRKDGKHYWADVHIKPIDEYGNIISDKAKIAGYLAIRREPKRNEINDALKLYKAMRKSELLEKKTLREWEKELLEKIDSL